jgi:multiple sugar transport system permease protein
MLNSLIGLALFYTTFNLPVGVYVMRNRFLQVPREIVDAARVDGASVTRTLLSVLRPLVLPGIATSALYAFLFSWTEFLGALSFMTNDSLFTLPVALSNVETGTYGAVNYGLLLAGAVIARSLASWSTSRCSATTCAAWSPVRSRAEPVLPDDRPQT